MAEMHFNILGSLSVADTLDLDQAGVRVGVSLSTLVAQVASPVLLSASCPSNSGFRGNQSPRLYQALRSSRVSADLNLETVVLYVTYFT